MSSWLLQLVSGLAGGFNGTRPLSQKLGYTFEIHTLDSASYCTNKPPQTQRQSQQSSKEWLHYQILCIGYKNIWEMLRETHVTTFYTWTTWEESVLKHVHTYKLSTMECCWKPLKWPHWAVVIVTYRPALTSVQRRSRLWSRHTEALGCKMKLHFMTTVIVVIAHATHLVVVVVATAS